MGPHAQKDERDSRRRSGRQGRLMDGRAYLEKFIADRFRVPPRTSDAGRDRDLVLLEVHGVATGLVAAGALSEHDRDQALADLDLALQHAARRPRRRADSHSTAHSRNPPSATVADVARGGSQETAPGTAAPVLRRVLPLDATLDVQDETVTLICLESWSTMLLLNVAFPIDPQQTPSRFRTRRDHTWRGWDDAGTTYRLTGSGAFNNHGVHFERICFQPGLPDDARTLTLTSSYEGATSELTIPLKPGDRQ
ncbi:hypothetical protein ABZS66_59955 [Dactylosporangium sp. NPDC005572]|uniref:hypothetical protein n=1 Tax=Dactylosporangium sp. NPDC005572 TaxID=3156889 RepID=UPI0033B84D2C